MKKVVGIGEILWDMLPGGKQLGGAPANFAYHATALGGAGSVVSCVGADRLGHEIIVRLGALGLDQSGLAVDPEHPTGTVDVQLDDHGKPSYAIREQVAWDYIPWSDSLRELAAKTDAVCYGTLAQRAEVSRTSIRDFLKATPSACLRIFDVNLRMDFFNSEIIRSTLLLSNALKINDEELPVVARLLDIRGAEAAVLSELLRRFKLRLVALTRGDQGSVLMSAAGIHVHPGIRTSVVDTVGAGDAFTAGVVMGLLQGLRLDQVNDLANRLASHVCSQAGATPPMPPALLAY